MPATAQILDEMAAAPPKGVVFDVGSLKSPLRKGLTELRAAGGNVCSVHPMFGPDTELLSGRHVIFVDLGAPEATAAARALFEPTMATLVEMDLESHDRLIAYVLGLSHALNIAFFTALAESGEAAPKLATLSSTTFDAQLSRGRRGRAREPGSLLRDPDAQRLRDRIARGAALRGRALALRRARERHRRLPRADDARQSVSRRARTPLKHLLRAKPCERVADRGLERAVRVAELALRLLRREAELSVYA